MNQSTVEKTRFVHLHNHSDASLLDGLSRVKDIIKRAKELGHESVAITDHGNLFNAIAFYKEAIKEGIKPIIGVESYICKDINESNRKQNHITLLAKSAQGVCTLNKLLTIANTQGFYYYPRIDPNILCANKDDIIVLSGCIGGLICQAILKGELDLAADYVRRFRDEFGDDFYLEVQDSGLEEQQITIAALREFSRDFSIPCVATNDAHYAYPDDALTQEIILTAGQRKRLSDPVKGYNEFGEEARGSRWRFDSTDYYMKDRTELEPLFLPEELDITAEIADKVDIELEFGASKMPSFPHLPEDTTKFDYLRQLCWQGFQRLGLPTSEHFKAYIQRMKAELADIEDGNLADYFLIVWDVCRFCRESGISIGDGRGSAVGSLVAYALDIHTCDPLEYDLIWERFYNSARKGSMPDIDLDIETERREEVLEYIRTTFGENRVFQFLTLDSYKVKNAIKDIGRVLGYGLDETQLMSDTVPFKYKDLDDAMDQSEELRKHAEENPELFKHIRKVEDAKKAKSSHASAVLVCDTDIFDTGCVPLSWDAKNKKAVTGWDMYALESLGYLKLDILGLKTVSVLSEVERLVNG